MPCRRLCTDFESGNHVTRIQENHWDIYGSELSPFTLKLIALCDYTELPYRFVPADTSVWHSLKTLHRKEKLIKGKAPLSWPEMDEEDEYPLVPFLFGPDGENLYDSTAIARWLDDNIAKPDQQLIPDNPAMAFIVRLIDDYADEFGLYMVHHQRWKISASDNTGGRRLANEFRRLLGPLQGPFAAWFSARQVRRLPYLFSVADKAFKIPGLPKWRQPPAKAGFPSTHEFLESSFIRLLNILEELLSKRPYILGSRFSLADAAIYGELAMNLDDPSTAIQIKNTTPVLFNWLVRIRNHDIPRPAEGKWCLDNDLRPLLNEICRTHIPLMQLNITAYEQWREQGETVFNEKALSAGRALYDGMLGEQEFRHVAKSFQAKVWRKCLQHWRSLSQVDKATLENLLPEDHGIDYRKSTVRLVSQ